MPGGSDYHGEYKLNIDMAVGFGKLNIEENIIANWKEKVKLT